MKDIKEGKEGRREGRKEGRKEGKKGRKEGRKEGKMVSQRQCDGGYARKHLPTSAGEYKGSGGEGEITNLG
jgi:hypothetical protein